MTAVTTCLGCGRTPACWLLHEFASNLLQAMIENEDYERRKTTGRAIRIRRLPNS